MRQWASTVREDLTDQEPPAAEAVDRELARLAELLPPAGQVAAIERVADVLEQYRGRWSAERYHNDGEVLDALICDLAQWCQWRGYDLGFSVRQAACVNDPEAAADE
jgi:hypothetical protein